MTSRAPERCKRFRKFRAKNFIFNDASHFRQPSDTGGNEILTLTKSDDPT